MEFGGALACVTDSSSSMEARSLTETKTSSKPAMSRTPGRRRKTRDRRHPPIQTDCVPRGILGSALRAASCLRHRPTSQSWMRFRSRHCRENPHPVATRLKWWAPFRPLKRPKPQSRRVFVSVLGAAIRKGKDRRCVDLCCVAIPGRGRETSPAVCVARRRTASRWLSIAFNCAGIDFEVICVFSCVVVADASKSKQLFDR